MSLEVIGHSQRIHRDRYELATVTFTKGNLTGVQTFPSRRVSPQGVVSNDVVTGEEGPSLDAWPHGPEAGGRKIPVVGVRLDGLMVGIEVAQPHLLRWFVSSGQRSHSKRRNNHCQRQQQCQLPEAQYAPTER